MKNDKNIEELISNLRDIHLSYSNIYTNSGVMSSAHLPNVDVLNNLNKYTSELVSQINQNGGVDSQLIDNIEGSLRLLATIRELDPITTEQTITKLRKAFNK